MWTYNDGGRASAGFRGAASDCVCRAHAVVSGRDYAAVYADLNSIEDRARNGKRLSSARTGIRKSVTRDYLCSVGYTWHPTMQIGSGCHVHLRAEELPPGRIIVKLSRHVCAVIDGVIHDTYDPSRNGTRCVYGYWTLDAQLARKE